MPTLAVDTEVDLTAERAWLARLHRRYNHRRFVSPDPLEVLYGYENCELANLEVVGLIASSLAYGNVKAMLPAIRGVLESVGDEPATRLADLSPRAITARFRGFKYRFTTGEQLAGLLIAARKILNRYGGIEACIARHLGDTDETVLPALGGFVSEMCAASPVSLDHLLPHPDRGSACKRLNLYLRWMVRQDVIDPGGWDSIRPAQLIMPIDTHVYQTAVWRGWTARKGANLRTALEITSFLRQMAPNDPLRWDFAVTRPGIRNEAPGYAKT